MAELGFRSIKSHTSLECNFNIFITLVGIIYWNRIIRIKIPTKNTFQIISETMRSDKLGSQLDRKSKTFFFTFFNVLFYFPESKKTKFSCCSFHLQISDILQTRMDQSGDHMKINFDNF